MNTVSQEGIASELQRLTPSENGDKIEALWALTASSTATGINKEREKFQRTFLQNVVSYLDQKYGINKEKKLKELGRFLQEFTQETNILTKSDYDPISQITDEMELVQAELERHNEFRSMLLQYLDDNFAKLDSSTQTILKYILVNEQMDTFRTVWEDKLEEEDIEIPDRDDLREIQFRSGLFLSNTYIDSKGRRTEHRPWTPAFLAEFFFYEVLDAGERDRIERSLQAKVKSEEAEEEPDEEENLWGASEIIGEKEEEDQREESIRDFVQALKREEEFAKLDVLYMLAYNPSSKSGAAKQSGYWKNLFKDWFQEIAEYNLQQKYEDAAGTEALEVVQELRDQVDGFMYYDNYDSDKEVLKAGLNFYPKLVEIDTNELNEKVKTSFSFFKRYCNDTEKTTLPIGERYPTSLNDFAGKLSTTTPFDFKRKTHIFTKTSSKSFLGQSSYETTEYPCSELGDLLLEHGAGMYNVYVSGSDNLRINLQIIPEVLQRINITALDQSIADLEAVEEDINLTEISPSQFENLITEIIANEGFDARNIGGAGDLGADVLAEGKGQTITIQVKHTESGSIGPRAVREASSARDNYNSDRTIAASSTRFSDQAREEADKQDVELWDNSTISQKIDQLEIELREYL